MIEERHAFLDEPLGTGQADAALIGQQFANRADAAAAEVINVIQRTFAFFEPEQIFRRRHQIILRQNARRFLVLQSELLIDFITANAAQIIAFGVEEQSLEQGAGVRRGRRIPGAQTTVNVLERFFLVFGRILLETFDEDALVHGGVHDLDFVNAQLGDLFDDGLRQRLERARNDKALFFIHGVLNQNVVRQILEFLGLFDREFLDFIKQFDDFLIRAPRFFTIILALADAAFDIQKAQRTEEGGRQKFPAAFLAVKINVQQVARVKLRLVPRAAVGDDAEAVQGFAVRVLGGFKGNAGRAMKLAHHNAFRAVDDECALRRHQRQFAHEHFFLFGALALFLEQKRDVKRRAVGQTFAQTFKPIHLGLADLVGFVVQLALFIVALDGKNLAEDRFQAGVFLASIRRRGGLQKFRVRIGLQFNHVRRHNDFFDLAEVDSFCDSRWHLDFLVWPATAPDRHFLFNDTRQARRVQRPACQTKLLFVSARNL